MEVDDVVKALEVNCRIGSLEKLFVIDFLGKGVNCRIGSLESIRRRTFAVGIVNCRIGSLENPA